MTGEMAEKNHDILKKTKIRRRHKSDSHLESMTISGHANEQAVLNCKLTEGFENDFKADSKASSLSKISVGGESNHATPQNGVSFFHLVSNLRNID